MLERILALTMLPVGLLIVLEELGIFSLLSFDKVLIGSLLMIATQVFTLISLNRHHQGFRAINFVSFIVLIAPAVIYLITMFSNSISELPLIIGVMMFVEGMYALH